MEYLLHILLVFTLAAIVYQDLKFRRIHVLLPLFVFGFGVTLAVRKGTFMLNQLVYSIGFVVLNFALLTVYFSLKNKKLLNPFKLYVGLGDVLYLFAVTPLFVFQSYVVYFVLGMFLSLLFYVLFRRLYSCDKTIPLAGYLSLFLIVLFIAKTMFNNNILSIFIF